MTRTSRTGSTRPRSGAPVARATPPASRSCGPSTATPGPRPLTSTSRRTDQRRDLPCSVAYIRSSGGGFMFNDGDLAGTEGHWKYSEEFIESLSGPNVARVLAYVTDLSHTYSGDHGDLFLDLAQAEGYDLGAQLAGTGITPSGQPTVDAAQHAVTSWSSDIRMIEFQDGRLKGVTLYTLTWPGGSCNACRLSDYAYGTVASGSNLTTQLP